MIRYFKYNVVLVISYFILTNLTSCKKYPDNDLWFVSPESAFKGGNITAYTVDGVDSIPMWDAIYSNPPYNGGSKYKVSDFIFTINHKGELGSNIGGGSFHFFNNKKNIYIFFIMTNNPWNPYPKYNFFNTREGNWKIIKLTKRGTFRIQQTYNNKVYEIQFN